MALTDNLLSYWKLDESSGNGSDSIGVNTLTNNNTATYSAGKINNGVNLNGTNQYLRKAPTITNLPNTVFSFGGWIKADVTTGAVCASFGLDGSNRGFALHIDGAKFTTEFQIGSGTGKVQSSTISSATWYHVIATCDGTNVVLYINGSSVGSVSRGSGQAGSGGAIILGGWVDGSGNINGNYFDGSLDEFGIWTRALSSTEVSQLYNSGTGLVPIGLTTALASFYNFDESSGNPVDSMGNYGLTNNNTVGYITGKIKNAVTLGTGNTNKYLSATHLDPDTYNNGFSISFWLKFNTVPSGSDNDIFEFADSGGWGGTFMRVNSSTSTTFRFGNGIGSDGGNTSYTSAWTTGVWYHIVMTHSTNANTYYVNGTQVAQRTTSLTLANNGTTFNIGRNTAAVNYSNTQYDLFGIWTRELSSTEVSSLYNSGNALNPITLTTNLISYYKLDESSGNASDSVSSNTLTNVGTATYSAGKINNGIDLNGSSQYLDGGNVLDLTTGSWTFAAWIKVTTTGSYEFIGGRSESGFSNDWYMRVTNTNKAEIQFRNGASSNQVIGNITVADGNWHHVVGLRNGTNVLLYVDGILDGSGTDNNYNCTNAFDFHIGADSSGSLNFKFNGQIDEVGIWNRGLSADEILQIHNSGRANAYPLTSNPSLYGGITYWKLDESSGNASDSVGSNTLTNTGSATYSGAVINNGLTTNGTSNYLQTSSKILNTTAYSISVWLKNGNASQPTDVTIFSNQTDASNFGVMMSIDSTGNSYVVRCGNGSGSWQVSSSFAISTSAFEHYVLVVNGTSRTLYRNGSSIISDTLSSVTNFASSSNFTVGINPPVTAGRYWNGRYDEFGLWSRDLSSTEVASLYNSGSGLQWPFTDITLSVSVNDLINTTESTTRIGPSIDINKFDSITVSENITRSGSLGGINISDSLNLSETITRGMSSFINVNDSIGVAENYIVSTPAFSFAPSVLDILSITESVQVSMSQLGDINVSDLVQTSESTSFENIFGLDVFDTISSSESINTSLNASLSVFDSVSISENILTESFYSIVISDSVNLSENITMESFRFSPDMPGKIIGTMIKSV